MGENGEILFFLNILKFEKLVQKFVVLFCSPQYQKKLTAQKQSKYLPKQNQDNELKIPSAIFLISVINGPFTEWFPFLRNFCSFSQYDAFLFVQRGH